jgi:hypothetical protein
MSVDASGMPVVVAYSVKDAVAAANDVITERRRFFSGRSDEEN